MRSIRIGCVLGALALLSAVSGCATTRPRPADVPTLSVLSVRQDSLRVDSLAGLPDSLPKPTFIQRLTGGVFGGGSGKTKTVQKFKGPTTIIIGNNNAGSSATKPGPAATGTGAVATEAKKADAPVVVGEGNQAASSRKGPAVAGTGNSVTVPLPSNWWKWLLGGTVLGFALRQFGPMLLKGALGI